MGRSHRKQSINARVLSLICLVMPVTRSQPAGCVRPLVSERLILSTESVSIAWMRTPQRARLPLPRSVPLRTTSLSMGRVNYPAMPLLSR